MAITRHVALFGRKFWISIAEGEIVGQQQWAETQVHGSGGGGYHNGVYGHVSPVRIHSTTTHRNEFWVREPDGQESCYHFANTAFQFREGHRVRLGWAAVEGVTTGDHVFASNLTAGQTVEHKTLDQWVKYLKSLNVVDAPPMYRLGKFLVALGLGLGLTMMLFSLQAGGGSPLELAMLMLAAAPFTLGGALLFGGIAYLGLSVLGRVFFLSSWRANRARAIRDALWQEFQRPLGA